MKKNKSYYLKIILIAAVGAWGIISSARGQTITVTGRVTELTGDAVPGVNVVVKGSTSSGTITDKDGRYTLERVPTTSTLSFSFIGFKTREVSVEGRTIIDVQMEEEVTTLMEVVVNAGYYTVKERERTGSIVKVTSKEIEGQPVSNALSAVQGRTAGVSITQSSGIPGSGYDIKIRGTNSLRRAGNYPMYIIDGVPVSAENSSQLSGAILPYGEFNPLSSINPNDIESIEILKDADATAIYGSRGANGIILITTKKGEAGRRTKFNLNSSYGVSQIANKLELMNTEQYLEMRRQAYANDGITTYPANAYDINGTWDQTRHTDWQEELIGGTAISSSVQLSVSGGSNNTCFLISTSHNEQTTVFGKDFKFKTSNLSGNISHTSIDKRLTINASWQFSGQSNNLIASDITGQTLRLAPNAPALYHDDGSLNWENNTFTNPLASYESTYHYDNKTLNTNLNVSYELLPSIYLKLNGGLNHQVAEELSLSPHTRFNPAFGSTSARSSSTKGQNNQFTYLFEPQINYKHRFAEHEIDILVGGTYQERENTMNRIYGYGYKNNALITNLTAANTIYILNDSKTEYKYAAIFGRINYQFKNRYILNLTGRRDGSSRFGPDKRFANFGAVGAAWIFSEERFLSGSRWLSFGKLRASYGITGSDLIGDYQYLDTYTLSSIGYGGSIGLYPSRLHNPYFSWETTTKLEIALETGFLNDRIHLSSAWYLNRSDNQLVGIPLPATTGFSSIQANMPATVENRGVEIELHAKAVTTNSFEWTSSINISIPRNKLVSFPGLAGSTYANTYVEGYPTSIVKVYNYEGIDPSTGLYTFTDYNNDGNISSPDDNMVIEDIGVKLFGGWTNQLNYKNWGFSFLFQFVNQNQKNYNALMMNPGTLNNQPIEVLDVWSPENPDGHYMGFTSGANAEKNTLLGYFRSSSATIDDASFIRLKNIQINYRLPMKKYLEDVRFYVQGQNLLTITNYFGVDPEFTTTGFLPPLKTMSFGVQLNF